MERDVAAEQADGFRQWTQILVSTYEALDEDARNRLRIDLGYLPEAAPVAGAVALRLHEFTLHSWDVAVTRDATATLAPEAVEHILGVSDFMIGWIGRPQPGRPFTVAVRTTAPGRSMQLDVTPDAVRLQPDGDDRADDVAVAVARSGPDSTLTLPAESWLRLVSGRLAPEHTPDEVTISGAVTLDDLRQVFPGY